jgi:Ser/Thr protein kinase RdoA (MazF antagonist)
LDRLRAPASRSKRARNAAFRLALAHGAVPEPRAVQTIALDAPALPFLVQPARELGVAAGSAWLQALGGEDVLSRGVFHLFAPGERDPQWVVKFARTQGHAAPFEADERGLRLAAGAGGEVAVHAPSLLGRFNVGGFEASAETAVVGRPLSQALVAPGRREQPLRMVERVAAWTVALARRTVSSAEAAAPELRRLRDEVIPEWLPHGAPADLLERLPSMRAVLAHNDLGTWNVIVEDGSFGITDWESARDGALPIWDLLYLLADALPILGGARTVPERVANTLALLRGSHPYSRVLFRWLEVAAKTTGVSPEAIGPLATLCWLHHGRSHLRRWAAAELAQPGSRKFLPPAEQIAAPWLKDPELGAAWPAWQRYVAASI